MLVNARHVKNMPGRKERCLRAGMAGPTRGARTRTRLVRAPRPGAPVARPDPNPHDGHRERSREIQRREKPLEDAGTKGVLGGLGQTSPASSGRAMLEAMIAGQHDPVELAELARRRLRVKIPELTEALTGRFSEHHAFLARVHLDLNDRHTRTVKELTARVEHVIEPLPPRPRPDHHDPRDQH